MTQSLRRIAASVAAFAGKNTDDKVLGMVAVATVFFVVVVPFTVVKYPPIVDLPFHAAQIAILTHFTDPAWRFQEQFSLHPLEVPYLSMYAISALAAHVLPIEAAVKTGAVAMLLLLPAGLAVLFHGMRKSPLLGLLGLGLVWCTLTYWGFLNFMGALGLYAASIGFALRCVDRPSRAAQVGLALTLVAIFFTHIYRVPFALASVLGAGAFAYPATRRFRPLLAPLAPAVALFVLWQFVREKDLVAPLTGLTFELERVEQIPKHLFGAYLPPEPVPMTPLGAAERRIAKWLLAALAVVAVTTVAAFIREGRARGRTREEKLWAAAVTLLPLGIASSLLVLYFTLPFELGSWFYVYPREIVAAVFIGVSALPDLPRKHAYKLGLLAIIAVASAQMSGLATRQFRRFDSLTKDFDAVIEHIPPAPKLLYLMYDLTGTDRRAPPLLHFPAWVQAKKGGWLGFHFVAWNHSPIRYREGSASVPPALPRRFEWEPQHFRVGQHGAWFDTFLVRHRIDPTAHLFGSEPDIELVARHGSWWLYRRRARHR